MKKQVLALTIGAALISGFAMADAPATVLQKADAVEQIVYGQEQPGALVDRINQLDDTVYGKEQSGTLSKKIDNLYLSVEGQGQDVSIRQELEALELAYMSKVTEGSLVNRVEQMERSVTGRVSKGPLMARIKHLEDVTVGGPLTITLMPATIPQNHVFKITLDTPISTKTNQAGEKFTFTVAENIMDGNTIVVPAGTQGSGYISSIAKARSFGRNGKLDLVFETVPTIDGGSFTAVQGEEAQEKTKSELKAAGASVAGVVLLGPIGLAGGFFVHGNNIELPVGSAMYVQPQDAVTATGVDIGMAGQAPDAAATRVATRTAADGVVVDREAKVVYVPDGTGQGASTADPVATEKVEQTKAAAKAQATSSAPVKAASAAADKAESVTTAAKAKVSDSTAAVKAAAQKSDSAVAAQADPIPSEAIVVIKRNQ